MVVRFEKEALLHNQNMKDLGIESEKSAPKVSEVDRLLGETKAKIADGSSPAVGVSPSNSGRGHDHIQRSDEDFVPTSLDGAVLEEEPTTLSDSETEVDEDSKKVTNTRTEAEPQQMDDKAKKDPEV